MNVTLHVVDDDGKPVEGADAGVAYWYFDPEKKTETELEPPGKTDRNGQALIQESTFEPQVRYGAGKAGFYRTSDLKYEFKEQKDKKWEPWNPTLEVMLKRIINPIPMYARSVNLKMPVAGKPAGYDLMIGDWVAPYGAGKTADIIFTATLVKGTENYMSYTLQVSFSNAQDGIQTFDAPPRGQGGSKLRSPQTAPADGYKPEWIQTRTSKPGQKEGGNMDGNRNYFIRVRTVSDKQGKIVSANYGKIYGDFLQFVHYLNPNINDRNVEFDPTHNLITNLKAFEEVSDP